MNTAVATKKPSLGGLIEQMKPEIARVLPAQMNPDRMARIATTCVRQTPALARTTPESFLGALLTASQLGLEPGGPRPGCYLVPYGNVCTFIPSWFGLVDLARRSGQVVDVWAEIVYENDAFEYTLGLNRTITRHDPPPLGQDRGKPIGVYAAAELTSGGKPFVVMTVDEVEAIRKQSRAAKNGPWVTHWGPMAKKSAVRQLSKWLPQSAEMSVALAQDGAVRTEVTRLDQAIVPTYIDGDTGEALSAPAAPVPVHGQSYEDEPQENAGVADESDDPGPDGPGPADGPPADVQMASRRQLADLKKIRTAEKYDADLEWFGFLSDLLGEQITRESDITASHADRILATITDGGAQ